MSDKCCNRIGVQSTHWEGCHEVHPSCAAYKAGREAGMREAAGICDMTIAEILLLAGELAAAEKRAVKAVLDSRVRAILAAIGEGK